MHTYIEYPEQWGAGQQKVFSIGVYPAVSLSDARQRRDDAKKLLAAGIDPSAKKQADNKIVQEKRNNTRAFKTVARNWFATKTTWSEDYQRSVWTRIETYLLPDIGNKDIAELDTGDLLVPIKKIEKLGYLEIAMRVKQYATAIMRYAVQQKMIRFNPAYDLEGAVQKPQTEHRPAVELEEIPALLERIEGYKGRSRLTQLATKLNLLIFCKF